MIGEKVTFMQGLFVTLFSMGIVFLTLILISFMIDGIRNVFGRKKKEEIVEKNAELVAVEEVENDDEELVAVISAAVASMLSTSIDNIHIKSIKRIPQTTGVWGRMGRQEQLYK
ncbi:OadG family protein [Abyssisolibacter fermentans]|uniref:OadG family protein n=1 Tax=Abyssisolibacter fermentans TaxID=1766203 RepID=UPI00082BB676|nr:OadG family protein [Abyssisolibacter fermentans]